MDLLSQKVKNKYDIIGGKKNYRIIKKCLGVTFDPDSSPDTWIFFLKRYPKLISLGNVEMSIEENLYCFKPSEKWNTSGNRNRNKRIRYSYQLNSDKYLNLAGDCDFNFRKTRFTKFEMIIKQSNLSQSKKLKLLNKLYFCNIIHHTHLNFSLFPVSSNLQFLKGRSDDRLDLFLVDLKQFYSKKQKKSKVYKKSSKEIQIYFNSFETFENYINMIYHIDLNKHKNFGNELLTLPETLLNTDDLDRYFDIVLKYWELRMEYFESLGIT